METYEKLNQKAFDKIAEKYGGYRRKTPEIIENFIKESKNKILDLGCGNLSYLLNYPTKVYGIDFSFNSLKKIDRENTYAINGDITQLPVKSGSFSKATCIYTLHNLSPKMQEKAMCELNRILKENSQALITVWAKYQQRFFSLQNIINFRNNKPIPVKWGNTTRYYFLFTKNQLRKLCEQAGFKVNILGTIKTRKNKNFYALIEKTGKPCFNKKLNPKHAYKKVRKISKEAKEKYDKITEHPIISSPK